MKYDPSVPGWTSIKKLKLMSHIAGVANYRKDSSILEVGTWAGRTLVALGRSAPKAKIISVDNSVGYNLSSMEPDQLSSLKGDVAKFNMYVVPVDQVRRDACRFNNIENVEFYDGRSADFFASNTDTYDLIFIDGDHGYEGVYEDIENSYKVLRKGGCLCGDDYAFWPDVKQAVIDFTEANGLKHHHYLESDLWIIYDDREEFCRWFPEPLDFIYNGT